MKGFIKQIIGEDIEELYWFPADIEDEIIRVAYFNFVDEDFDSFEVWWNLRNSDLKIERIFLEKIFI